MDVRFIKLTSLILTASLIWCVKGNPVYLHTEDSVGTYPYETSVNTGSLVENSSETEAWNQTGRLLAVDPICSAEFSPESFVSLDNGNVFIPAHESVYEPSEFKIIEGKLCLMTEIEEHGLESAHLNGTIVELKCTKTWYYEPGEFEIFPNGTVVLYFEGGYDLIEKGAYVCEGNRLKTCAADYDYPDTDTSPSPYLTETILMYVGKVGSIISVISLCLHIIVFCLVPTIRNLPSYNLLSMSVAYLVGYCFTLIGQIPEVLGTFCVVSGVLVHFFFLAAFFWMNVMTYDVWRALKLATEKLVSTRTELRAKKFLFYSIYAWGMPTIFTTASLVIDNTDYIADDVKPGYGKGDRCWITNDFAKLAFFVGPAFALFIINGVFFCICAYIIATNVMKNTGEHNTVAKTNFTLYVRLGLIMGVTWSIGILGVILKSPALWFAFDILNSLQGLFVFLFFTCSKKVLTHLRKKVQNKRTSSIFFQSSTSTKSTSQ